MILWAVLVCGHMDRVVVEWSSGRPVNGGDLGGWQWSGGFANGGDFWEWWMSEYLFASIGHYQF